MRYLMVALLAATSAATVLAQVGEVSVSAGASRMNNNSIGTFVDSTGNTVPDPNATITSNFRLGVRLTVNSYRFFGHEFGYAYNHGNFQYQGTTYGMPMHQGMYNFLVYATPEGSKVRPYATGGVHFTSFYPPGASVFQGNGITKFGYNYGAGVKFRVSETWITRFDFRDYVTGKPDFGLSPSGRLHMYEISAGFGMAF